MAPEEELHHILEEIDDDGELVMSLDPATEPIQTLRFRVSAAALRFASPVWKSIVAKKDEWHNQEHFGLGLPTREFRDDDPDAMRILLHLAHLQFKKVPATVSVHTLYSIAKLTDKYGTRDLVVKYAKVWGAPFKKSRIFGLQKPQDMWIGWLCGIKEYLSPHLSNTMMKLSEAEVEALADIPVAFKGALLHLVHFDASFLFADTALEHTLRMMRNHSKRIGSALLVLRNSVDHAGLLNVLQYDNHSCAFALEDGVPSYEKDMCALYRWNAIMYLFRRSKIPWQGPILDLKEVCLSTIVEAADGMIRMNHSNAKFWWHGAYWQCSSEIEKFASLVKEVRGSVQHVDEELDVLFSGM